MLPRGDVGLSLLEDPSSHVGHRPLCRDHTYGQGTLSLPQREDYSSKREGGLKPVVGVSGPCGVKMGSGDAQPREQTRRTREAGRKCPGEKAC